MMVLLIMQNNIIMKPLNQNKMCKNKFMNWLDDLDIQTLTEELKEEIKERAEEAFDEEMDEAYSYCFKRYKSYSKKVQADC